MSQIKRFIQNKRGVTLLELAVVGAILSILAALTAVGVTGQATSSKGTAKTNDVSEVQKAVDNFVGQNPKGTYPTANGALPTSGTSYIVWNAYFVTRQDLNSDGDVEDTGEVTAKFLVPDLISRFPKHARQHTDGSGWTASCSTTITGLSSSSDGSVGSCAPDTGMSAVWVIDTSGKVTANVNDDEF